MPWFAVRCVFEIDWARQPDTSTYEERITLWNAPAAAEAIERAEAEARAHAAALDDAPTTYLQLAQSFELFDEPGDGAEVFSLMRDSALDRSAYLDTFFDTGSERRQPPLP